MNSNQAVQLCSDTQMVGSGLKSDGANVFTTNSIHVYYCFMDLNYICQLLAHLSGLGFMDANGIAHAKTIKPTPNVPQQWHSRFIQIELLDYSFAHTCSILGLNTQLLWLILSLCILILSAHVTLMIDLLFRIANCTTKTHKGTQHNTTATHLLVHTIRT